MRWIGSFQLRSYLLKSIDPKQVWPPEANGVYLISRNSWNEQPDQKSGVLYLGSNTGMSSRFRTRIGDLVADMLGFYCEETGHSSGGISLHKYCCEKMINPLDLFIGWKIECPCVRCEKNSLYDQLKPELNKKRPSRCKNHTK